LNKKNNNIGDDSKLLAALTKSSGSRIGEGDVSLFSFMTDYSIIKRLWDEFKETEVSLNYPGAVDIWSELDSFKWQIWLRGVHCLARGEYKPSFACHIKSGGNEKNPDEDVLKNVTDLFMQFVIFKILFPKCGHIFRPGCYIYESEFKIFPARIKLGEPVLKTDGPYGIVINLQEFFSQITPDIVVARLERHFKSRRISRLVRRYLVLGVLKGGILLPTPESLPKGGALAPLLANLVLCDILELMNRKNISHIRIGDSIFIFTKNSNARNGIFKIMEKFLKKRMICDKTDSVIWKRDFAPRIPAAGGSFSGIGCLANLIYLYMRKNFSPIPVP